jgi:hypothetical protein
VGSSGDPDHIEREEHRERGRAAPHTKREEEPPTVGRIRGRKDRYTEEEPPPVWRS